MSPTIVIMVIVSLIIVTLIVGVPLKLFRYFGQVAVKLLIAAIALYFFNVFGNNFGLHIPINLVTTAITGILGILGLIGLVLIKLVILP